VSITSPEVSADAPGFDGTASRFADGAAGRVPPLFTAPLFRMFCALAAGFFAQAGRRTVCGMLTGAGLSPVWRHDRAHRFFSHARWSAGALGLALAKLIVALLVPGGEPVLVANDDTLFKRTGRKVHAIGWFHDGSATGPRQVGWATPG
jgi:DDE superfamily endonuclease